MKRFFSHDPQGNGLQFHDTAEEAEKDAEAALDLYREDAGDNGWDESAGEVCWGEVREIAIPSKVPAEEGATFNGEPVDHWVHYDLTATATAE